MKHFKFPSVTSVRLRLMLLVALCALLFSGVAVFRAVLERNRKVQALQDETARLAKGAAQNVSSVVEGTRQLLLSLAATEPVGRMDNPAASTVLAGKLKETKGYLNLGVVQPDGLIVGSSLPRDHQVYLPDRTYAERLQKKQKFSISDYLIDEATGKPSLNLGYPLAARPGMIAPGAVYASLDLSALSDCIAMANLPVNGVLLITDRQGVYLARHPDVDNWVGTKSRSWELMESKGEQRAGFIDSTGADLIPRTYYYTPVPGSDGNLYVAAGVTNAPILAECKSAMMKQLFWIGLWTVAGLVAAWFLGSGYRVVLNIFHKAPEPTRRVTQEVVIARARINEEAREPQQASEPTQRIAEEKASPEDKFIEPEPGPEKEPTQRITTEKAIAATAESKASVRETRQALEPIHCAVEEALSAAEALIAASTNITLSAQELPQAPEIILGSAAQQSVSANPVHQETEQEATQYQGATRRLTPTQMIPANTPFNGSSKLPEPPLPVVTVHMPVAAPEGDQSARNPLEYFKATPPVAAEASIPGPHPNSTPNNHATQNMNPTSPHTDGAPELNQLAQSLEAISSVLREHHERLERAVRDQAAAVAAVDEAWEQEIARHRQAEIVLKARRIDQEQGIRQLQEALERVKSIAGLLPLSSQSSKSREDRARWSSPADPTVVANNGAHGANGTSPDAAKKFAPEMKSERPPTSAKLNGFDAGPLYFADVKISVPPSQSKPL